MDSIYGTKRFRYICHALRIATSIHCLYLALHGVYYSVFLLHSTRIIIIATVRYDEGELIDGTLSESQTVRYKLTLPLLGVTIQVCVESGHVVVYGSASYPNPNSALNDFQLVLVCEDCQKEDSCKDVYVPPVVKPGNSSNARSKRSHSSGNETSVYISVVGMAAESKFTMNSTKGDVTVPTSDDNSTGTSSTTTNAPASKNIGIIAYVYIGMYSLSIILFTKA